MKTLIMLVLLYVLSPIISFAWNEPDGFRDVKWGATADILLKTFPGAYEFTNIPEKRQWGERVRVFMVDGYKIGNAQVNLAFNFLDGEFVYLYVYFKSKDFSILESAFKEKYGPPHTEESSTMKTRMGVEYANKELKWDGQTIRIRLNRYSSRVTDGMASMGKRQFLVYLSELKKRKSKEAAKDL